MWSSCATAGRFYLTRQRPELAKDQGLYAEISAISCAFIRRGLFDALKRGRRRSIRRRRRSRRFAIWRRLPSKRHVDHIISRAVFRVARLIRLFARREILAEEAAI